MTAIRTDTPRLQQGLTHLQSEHEALVERIRCQLRFAALLAERHPELAAGWTPLIAQAREMAESPILGNGGLSAVVTQVETLLKPLAEKAKSYSVYGIGHAHIDMNWMWSWPETVGVVIDTFTTVLRLMQEFPEFRFTQSQAEIYAIVEEHAPDLLERIAVQVKAGRWEVAASHWVEGDKNMAGGDSLCRQVLYAKRAMQRMFDLPSDALAIDWAPDTFGHPGTMPTYLSQAGIPYCFLHRPGAHAEKWPQAFRWNAADGATTLVFNGYRGGYNGVFCPRMMLDRITSWHQDTGLLFSPYMYGVGDHGGGPTRRDLLRFREMQQWPIFPTLQLSTARTFFDRLASESNKLPEVSGELNFAFAGCYTSQSLLKKTNRIAENRLDDAERAASAAHAVIGTKYPATKLEAAWRPLLFSQFHDILPGSCVHDSRTYSHGLFQQSMATVSQIETRALRGLASAISTDTHPESVSVSLPASHLRSGFSAGVGIGTVNGGITTADNAGAGDDREFVLFHLDQGERSEVVEATIWENTRDYTNLPFHRQAFEVLATDGTRCPAQILEKGTAWGHDFVRLVFPATIPAFGYAHYSVRTAGGDLETAKPGAWQLGRDDYPAQYSFHDLAQEGLENDLVRVELDAGSGGIRRFIDKRSGLALIDETSPVNLLEAGIERPHGMSSWAIDHAIEFRPVICTGLKRVCNGPHVAAIELTCTVFASEFVVTVELRRADPRVHITMRGTWREIGSAQRGVPFIRLSVPTTLTAAKLTCEVPFGAVERSFTHGEVIPALQWVNLTGTSPIGPASLLMVNDSKYGHALCGNVLRLDLIRSSYEPDPIPEVGAHEIRVALQVGTTDVPTAVQAGRRFNHPVRVIATDRHAGTLPATSEFVNLSNPNVTVLALKSAEDGSGSLIMRLNNPTTTTQSLSVTAGPALGARITAMQVCDLLEVPRSDSAPVTQVTLAAGGLTTLRLKFSK